uniref:GtrA family protein n=1 Tax=Thaumasiovibrio occultus TaxID=1891184 RepID=UPI000B357F56|nr:GtrA family protein [Thaumasiovibrio occultus]
MLRQEPQLNSQVQGGNAASPDQSRRATQTASVIRQTRLAPLKRFFRFAMVGGMGFAVDVLCFSVLASVLELQLARIAAFVAAVCTTYLGNRYFTFADRHKGEATAAHTEQALRFFAVALVTFIPNWVVFNLVLWTPLAGDVQPYLALVAGIFAGMMVNFVLSSRWVFAAKAPHRG